VARLGPGESAEVEAPVEDGPFLAVATGADTPLGRRTVVVVRSSDAVSETTAMVTGLLAVGLPLLLAVVAATTWMVVGQALAPVKVIRAEVDAISGAGLHRRVPDPAADDELGRLARTMNRMLVRLEQAQARQRRLVSDASHELRSPVATIRQHAEVALAHPGRTTTTELAATVLAEDLRLQRLAEDLLLLTRADEHTLVMRRRPVDLDDLVLEEAGGCGRPPGCGSTPPRCRPAGSTATPPGSGGCCATSATTPPGTPRGGWGSRSPRAGHGPAGGRRRRPRHPRGRPRASLRAVRAPRRRPRPRRRWQRSRPGHRGRAGHRPRRHGRRRLQPARGARVEVTLTGLADPAD
jgi:HAMP domain-containing protein